MNIKGIELLRELGLPGPKKELISTDLSKIDLDRLYDNPKRGATLLAFDYTESINQNPIFEKNVRKYDIQKEKYFDVLDELTDTLSKKGVSRKDMVFLTHETYLSEDISFSGRIAINSDENGFGSLMIDAVESLRKANTDFNPGFTYECPIIGGRIWRLEEKIEVDKFILPPEIRANLIRDTYRIPSNPNIDFEAYSDTGQLFYHDMFLAYK